MTVTSGFVALVNMALVDVFVKRGIVQDAYTFYNFVLARARRYWTADFPQRLGVYIWPLICPIETESRLNKERFWDFARLISQTLHEQLTEEKALPVIANGIIWKGQPDHAFNNMGDVTKLLARGKNDILVAFIGRSTSITATFQIWEHILQTLKGCLIHTLKYNTGIIPDEVAVEYTDNITKHLKEVI